MNSMLKGNTAMENVFIVSSSDKGIIYISEIVKSLFNCKITVSRSGGEARRMLMERDFDLVIINAPLRDETGESLALHVSSKDITQVILIVKREFFEDISAVCEREGVLTVSKPVNKYIFISALSLAQSAYYRLKKVQTENDLLRKNRRYPHYRPCQMYSYILFNMNEKEAHRYLEKQAMDMRITKRAVAERIIKHMKF